MAITGTYRVFEHGPERETIFTFEVVNGVQTGNVNIDAAPNLRETLPFLESSFDGNKFMVLIDYNQMKRRYRGEIIDGCARGAMTFEGGDFDGAQLPFDEKQVAAE